MPRQYITAAEFSAHPIGVKLNAGALGTGILAGAIERASSRCDEFCRRRLGLPGQTTLQGATVVGATSLILADAYAIGVDLGPDVVLQIGAGATQETVQVAWMTGFNPAGGNNQATINLLPGVTLQYAHGGGEAVVALYLEQSDLQGGATDPTDQAFAETQAGQLAQAHAPRLGVAESVRVVFLKNFPIVQVVKVQIAYPWANALDTGNVADLTIDWKEGWYRFPIGYFAPRGGLVYTTYLGGFSPVPSLVKTAMIYEVAAELAFGENYLGAQEYSRGNYRVRMAGRAADKNQSGRSLLFAHEAEEALRPFRNAAIGR